MPGKKLQCGYCSNVMLSDNLKRHAKSCRMKNYHATPALHPSSEEIKLAGQKRSIAENIATLDEIKSGSGKFGIADHHPRNLKVRKLVDEIVHDGQDVTLDNVTTKNIPHKLTPQAVAELFPLKKKVPPLHALTEVSTPSTPWTKGEIVGYSNERDGSDTDEDDNSDGEKSKPEVSDIDSEDSVTSNNEQPNAKLKLLPATVEGLRKRFTTSWREFTRYGKHE